jgi:putative FmdB family regulatory protein
MPIYEYKCTKCDNVFELLETTFNDVKEKKCTKCGSNAERIISLTSFHLKGTGWYKTDYKSTSSCSTSQANNTSACSSCPASKTDN